MLSILIDLENQRGFGLNILLLKFFDYGENSFYGETQFGLATSDTIFL